MFLSRSAVALTAVILIPVLNLSVYSPAIAADAGDAYMVEEQVLGSLAPNTHRAVQQALKSKGYYSGPVDGRFGPMSKKSVQKFRADKHIVRSGRNALKLDKPLVEALFGIRDFAVEGWEDQHCLLVRLDPVKNPDKSNLCGLDQSAAPAGQDEPAPDPGSGQL